MSRLRFRRILGILLASTASFAGCYSFNGGGGFPNDIRTLYIEPFDNQTSQFELDQQLFRTLQEKLPGQLGVRPSGQENADAVVRGKILRYENITQNYRPGDNNNVAVLTYQVTITISVEIVDRKRNVVLWDAQSLVGRGDYRANGDDETVGRTGALRHILQQIIDGAQSQW